MTTRTDMAAVRDGVLNVATYIVTPTLMVGDPPPRLSGTVQVTSAAEAVEVIDNGGTAVLPHEAWETAREVLVVLGLDQATQDDRIYFARTARVRRPG